MCQRVDYRGLLDMWFIFPLRRPLLSLVRALYDFVIPVGERRDTLWASCEREVRWIRVLLPFAPCDLRMQWDDSLTISDARFSGVALCSLQSSQDQVAALGRVSERARYKHNDASGRAREHAFRRSQRCVQ